MEPCRRGGALPPGRGPARTAGVLPVDGSPRPHPAARAGQQGVHRQAGAGPATADRPDRRRTARRGAGRRRGGRGRVAGLSVAADGHLRTAGRTRGRPRPHPPVCTRAGPRVRPRSAADPAGADGQERRRSRAAGLLRPPDRQQACGARRRPGQRARCGTGTRRRPHRAGDARDLRDPARGRTRDHGQPGRQRVARPAAPSRAAGSAAGPPGARRARRGRAAAPRLTGAHDHPGSPPRAHARRTGLCAG